MHATLAALFLVLAAPLAESEGDAGATEPGNESESEGEASDAGDADDPNGGPPGPGPSPKAKGCRVAGDDAAVLVLVPLLLLRRSRHATHRG